MTSRTHRGDPYAGQPGRRLFVAVPLPDPATAWVTEVVERVRRQALPAGMHDVRWVRLDGLHLTLRFLGPTADERVVPTADAVRAASASGRPCRIRIAGSGVFPTHGRPRTIWLGISDGAAELQAIAGSVEEALVDAGWPADGRPFRPHLTLARSDGLAAGPLVAQRLADAVGDDSVEADIDRLVLFESVTGGGPARYVAEMSAGLGDTP